MEDSEEGLSEPLRSRRGIGSVGGVRGLRPQATVRTYMRRQPAKPDTGRTPSSVTHPYRQNPLAHVPWLRVNRVSWL